MLHRPTGETRQRSEAGRANAKHKPSPRTVGSAHRDHFARWQATVGNRVVLQTLATQKTTPHSRALAVQPKLHIGAVDDTFEREADHVADTVMRMPGSAGAETPGLSLAPRGLQRKCGCGGMCASCRSGESDHEKEELRMKSVGPVAHAGLPAPLGVHQVLRSPGNLLDSATRAFMEPRFGRDFSGVRVHFGASAQQSAASIQAKAYTVGQNVVFGAGQYAPGTEEGRRLVAHELAHVVQQTSGDGSTVVAQRKPQDTGTKGSAAEVCNGYEPGELEKSKQEPGILDTPVSLLRQDTLLIGDFGVNSRHLKDSVRRDVVLRAWLSTRNPDTQLEVTGFSDCVGNEANNEFLREGRARNVGMMLNSILVSHRQPITVAVGKGFVASNANKVGRAQNRGATVFARVIPRPVVFHHHEPAPEPKPLPPFVCGPDITSELIDTIARLKSSFDRLSYSEREDVCGTLNSLLTGPSTWDIVDLHGGRHGDNDWIYKNYRPQCASQGADPKCGESIQVGDQCYYSGSVNYVIFGVMCRLCQQNLEEDVGSDYDEDHMLELIDFYKGPGLHVQLSFPPITFEESANWKTSRRWAQAGYRGWPTGGSPPAGDRNNCVPVCPIKYHGGQMLTRWCPHIDPYSTCNILSRGRRARR